MNGINILENLKVFIRPGQVTELRAFASGQILSGWYDYGNLELLARHAGDLENSCHGVYFLPNPVNPEACGRRNAIGIAGRTTHDIDILRRSWLLIDVDPVRGAGLSASLAERTAAWAVLELVQGLLELSGGFAGAVVGCSGNGYHLCYPIDLANDDLSRAKVKTILMGLDKRCSSAGAKVDLKTFNASRIWKLYGTVARKGDATADRPHSRSFLHSGSAPVGQAVIDGNNSAIDRVLAMWKLQSEAFQAIEVNLAEPEIHGRARAYLARMPSAIQGQGGSAVLYHAAMVLVEGFSLDQATAAGILLGEWNQRCQPPWSDREVLHTVQNAAKNATNKGHLLSGSPAAPGGQKQAYTGPDCVPSLLRVPTDATLEHLRQSIGAVQWVWEGWLQRGQLTYLAAEPGVGKTRLCVDLVRRIWSALPWPDGRPATAPAGSSVMMLCSDSQWSEIITMQDQMGFGDRAIYLNAEHDNACAGTMLDSAPDLAAFESRIERVKPLLVFVDTIGSATDRSQGKPEEAKQLFKPLAEIATRTRTCIVLVTHLSISGQALGRRIEGAVRQGLSLSHPDASQEYRRKLWVTKSNCLKPPALGVTMRTAGNEYDLTPPLDSDAGLAVVGKKKFDTNIQEDSEWLAIRLATAPERVGSIRTAAELAGISPPRLYRARDVIKAIEYLGQTDGRKWWKNCDS